MNPNLKNYLKRLSRIGLEVNYALDIGLSIAGLDKLQPFLPKGFTENADAWF